MKLYEQIGTMVFTQNDRYIVGASDKANEEFKKRSSNIIDVEPHKLRDVVELSCIEKMEMPSENYNNYTQITKMPAHCFGDNYGFKVQETIQSSVRAYCDGEINAEEIKQVLIDVCKDMRVYQSQSRHTTGIDSSDNKQIIEDVYEIFQKSNVECMVDVCFEQGSTIANAEGGGERNDWIYYDSDYYSKSQYLREVLQIASNEMAAEWNINTIDFEKIEEESKFNINGGLDFNSVWNWRANLRGICSMSEEWQPQDDFSFFYQANKNKTLLGETTLDSQAGICVVEFEGKKWTMEVPFNGTILLGGLRDHFNAKDLFMGNTQYDEANLFEYLEKFDIYTRFYGHNKTIRGE